MSSRQSVKPKAHFIRNSMSLIKRKRAIKPTFQCINSRFRIPNPQLLSPKRCNCPLNSRRLVQGPPARSGSCVKARGGPHQIHEFQVLKGSSTFSLKRASPRSWAFDTPFLGTLRRKNSTAIPGTDWKKIDFKHPKLTFLKNLIQILFKRTF